MAEIIQELVLTYIEEENPHKANTIINKILLTIGADTPKFITLIDTLEPFLIEDCSPSESAKGLGLLGEILSKVRHLDLSVKQISSIMTFIRAKICSVGCV